MPVIDLKFHNYRYFPYERHMAKLEVRRLLGVEPSEVNGSLRVRALNDIDTHTLQRFTYFKSIVVGDGRTVVPQQARLEASATAHGDPGLLRRQGTRYSAHGLHEYRGKFNPQMVRAVINILGLNVGDRIWDPFCGSGTVLLEARHQGFSAVGVDLNPLAVAITNAKLTAARARPDTLRHAADMIEERVRTQSTWITRKVLNDKVIERALGRSWLKRFRCWEYLSQWFPLPVLAQFAVILNSINEVASTSLRNVFRIILSDIARDISWQDPGDLRIRRRSDPASNYPAIEIFLATLRTRVESVVAARAHLSSNRVWQCAFEGDSSDIRSLRRRARQFLEEGIDCIVSSPPYATALPYIDTQRLSIALFGLATVQEIRQLDSALIGSREVSTRIRLELDESINKNQANLADEVWKLCKALKDAYDPDNDGFRRQNTPAVVYRYFSGMTRAMAAAKRYLRSGGRLTFIVGPNRTSLGGEEYFIDTPALLAAIGEHVGLKLIQRHELNTYSRYNIA